MTESLPTTLEPTTISERTRTTQVLGWGSFYVYGGSTKRYRVSGEHVRNAHDGGRGRLRPRQQQHQKRGRRQRPPTTEQMEHTRDTKRSQLHRNDDSTGPLNAQG